MPQRIEGPSRAPGGRAPGGDELLVLHAPADREVEQSARGGVKPLHGGDDGRLGRDAHRASRKFVGIGPMRFQRAEGPKTCAALVSSPAWRKRRRAPTAGGGAP